MPPKKSRFIATPSDPYFDGTLVDHAKKLHPDSDLEVEIRILADDDIPGNPQVKNGLAKADVIAIVKNALEYCLNAGDKNTKKYVHNTVNWVTSDYKVIQKTYNGDAKPMPGALYYHKHRMDPAVGLDTIFPCGEPHTFGMKLDAQIESPLESVDKTKITAARVRSRIVIENHPLFPGWRIDVSRTYTESGNIQILLPNVKHYTDLMFKNCETVDSALKSDAWNRAVQIEVEMEWVGEQMSPKRRVGAHEAFTKGPLLFQQWMSVDASGSNRAEFQETVFDIASLVMPAKRAQRFRSALGLKSLGVQVVDLNRRKFYTEWRHQAQRFAATPKADGDRTMIIGDSKGIRMIGADFTKISDEVPAQTFVLDGELLPDGRYMAFDCLVLGRACLDEPLKDRLTAARVATTMLPGRKFTVKDFVYLDGSEEKTSGESYDVIVKRFMKTKWDFDTDGVVFTPCDEPYFNMTVYKWKPPTHISVDFFMCPGSDGNDNIAVGTKIWLMSGISQEAFARMAFRPPRRWTSDNSRDLPEYFAVPFMPSIHPTAYEYELTKADVKMLKSHFGTTGGSLSKHVVEMGFVEGPHEDDVPFKFQMMRIRTDRANEIARGGYFGNDFRIAEMTCMSAANPLTIDDFRPIEDVERVTGALTEKAATASGYFSVVDNRRYAAVRAYNSTAKETIFRRYMSGKPSGLGLASGQGQDLRRWFESNVRHLTLVERDPQAIFEIINRKHTLVRGSGKIRPVANMRTNLRVARLDLAARDIVKSMIDLGFNRNVTVIHCALAIHYFTGSTNSVRLFVDIIEQTLAPGGWFVFSSFDGQRVLDLLRANAGTWATDDGKYRIEWVGPGALPAKLPKVGAKIRVKLPFSGDELYEEFLFDLEHWTTELQRRKINRSAVLPFGESEATRAFIGKKDTATLGKPELWKKLTDDDRTFAGLYSYYVFVR